MKTGMRDRLTVHGETNLRVSMTWRNGPGLLKLLGNFGPQCRDGSHDFESQPIGGGWGIVEGASRCRNCQTIADEIKVDGP